MIPNATVTSIIRTLVSFIVARLLLLPLATPLEHLFGVSSAAARTDLISWGVVVVGALWYVIVRAVESKWPAAGWLLGVAAKPAYSPEDVNLAITAPVQQPPAVASGVPPNTS